jgi:hypothetical protein
MHGRITGEDKRGQLAIDDPCQFESEDREPILDNVLSAQLE